LIINELLLNSIKYVATQQNCIISILAIEKNNKLHVEYADNGIGLPSSEQFERINSTGLRLVKALSKQIKSTVIIKKEDGEQKFLLDIPIK
jgi:two-component system, sensor histidine kinase PdtaS